VKRPLVIAPPGDTLAQAVLDELEELRVDAVKIRRLRGTRVALSSNGASITAPDLTSISDADIGWVLWRGIPFDIQFERESLTEIDREAERDGEYALAEWNSALSAFLDGDYPVINNPYPARQRPRFTTSWGARVWLRAGGPVHEMPLQRLSNLKPPRTSESAWAVTKGDADKAGDTQIDQARRGRELLAIHSPAVLRLWSVILCCGSIVEVAALEGQEMRSGLQAPQGVKECVRGAPRTDDLICQIWVSEHGGGKYALAGYDAFPPDQFLSRVRRRVAWSLVKNLPT
jgi:hypothetical protein